MKNKNGQVTIFIIIAIIIVGVVAIFFSFKGGLGISEIPASIEPAYTSFLSCLEDDTLTGVDILESQAGYITLPDFEPGSAYMPFSSQLNFLGNPIPYWYYVSGNNIQKEQIPTKGEMENQIGQFIEKEIRKCRLDSYKEQGFEISLGEPKANVNILDREIEVDLDMDFGVNKGDDSAFVRNHKITVKSELGNLHLEKPLTKKELKRIRKKELEKATKIMKIDHLHILNLPDSKLKDNKTKFYNKALKIINKNDMPDLIISFDKYGITGHNDHISNHNFLTLLM